MLKFVLGFVFLFAIGHSQLTNQTNTSSDHRIKPEIPDEPDSCCECWSQCFPASMSCDENAIFEIVNKIRGTRIANNIKGKFVSA